MGIFLRWMEKNSESSWDTARVYRCASEDGTYSLLTSQSASDNTYYDETGSASYWYKIAYYNSTSGNESLLSAAIKGGSGLGYVGIDEVRRFLKIQESEYTDTAIGEFIDRATRKINRKTGRTWLGVQIASNVYFDCPRMCDIGVEDVMLNLNVSDLISLTSLAIDDDGDGTYTTVDVADVVVYSNGWIWLNSVQHSDIAVESFPSEARYRVLASYTYGVSLPTPEIKHLCLMEVAQMLRYDEQRKEEIKELYGMFRYNNNELI